MLRLGTRTGADRRISIAPITVVNAGSSSPCESQCEADSGARQMTVRVAACSLVVHCRNVMTVQGAGELLWENTAYPEIERGQSIKGSHGYKLDACHSMAVGAACDKPRSSAAQVLMPSE